MGIYHAPSLEDYWDQRINRPLYQFTNYMSLFRFQQLKRFLHVSSFNDTSDQHFTSKVEPLLSRVNKRFQRYRVPASKVSIDEMMILFTGRSINTYGIKNKPVWEGYKVIALCDN